MSWGEPNSASTVSDNSTKRASSRDETFGPSRRSASTTAPDASTRYHEPSTAPATSWSGRPSTAETTRRSLRPVTGSTPNSTPASSGSTIGCTRTAIGCSAAPARRLESRTVRTARARPSTDPTSATDSNWPAAEDVAVSSTTDEERAMSGTSPSRSTTSASEGFAARSSSPGAERQKAVVSTMPGTVSTPMRPARASADAFPPTSAASVASSVSRPTTSAVVSFSFVEVGGVKVICTPPVRPDRCRAPGIDCLTIRSDVRLVIESSRRRLRHLEKRCPRPT